MVIIRKTNCVIQWIEIYPMNSIIHSYNQGQRTRCSFEQYGPGLDVVGSLDKNMPGFSVHTISDS